MNRTLPLLLGILTLILSAWTSNATAQCTPDPNATGLVYPDTLQTACPNQFYDVTLTLNVPADSTLGGFTAIIDSVQLNNLLGLPAGLSYECNPTSCVFPGNSTGCIRVFGTPTDTGEFELTIDGTIYFKVFGIPQQLTDVLPTEQKLIVGLTADALAEDANCNGSDGSATVAMTSGTAPFTFLWNDPNTQTDSIATGLAAGQYEVQVTDASGCVGVFEVIVSNAGGAVIDSTQSILGWLGCHDEMGGYIDPVVVGGQSPYSFSWSSGDTTQDLDNLSQGSYTLSVTDGQGCVTNQEFEVDAPNPLVVSTTSTTDPNCYAGSDGSITALAVGGQGNFIYTWDTDPPSSGPALTGLSAGTYNLTVEDELGCVKELEVILDEPDSLSVTFDIRTEDPQGAEDGRAEATVTGGTPPYNFDWGTISDSSVIDSVGAGTYVVTITDDNGCSITDSVTIDFTSNIYESAGLKAFRVYPNPAQEQFTVLLEMEAPHAVSLRLYDLHGRQVMSQQYGSATRTEVSLEVAELPAGLYLLDVQVAGHSFMQKVRVE